MNAIELGTKLVGLCKEGKNMDAVATLYGNDVVSVEAMDPPEGGSRVTEGLEAVKGKGQWWYDNHEVHGGDVKGPFPHGEDRFCVYFNYDVTFKPSSQRMQIEEVGLYTVKDGKVAKEEFFYHMG